MLNILFGTISGIISSMGMGGGTVLIYLLTAFANVEQHIAQGINLVFFIPTSLIATFINWKNKNIQKGTALIIIVFGIIGAYIGAKISSNLDVNKLRRYFGIFLIFVAIYEIYSIIKLYKKDNNKDV